MPQKIITLKDVELHRGAQPRRCRFADHPVVKKKPDGTYVVSTKFASVDRMFEAETGIETIGGQWGPYKFLSDDAEIEQALAWQDSRKSIIFLRDSLYCSIALAFNLADHAVYTEMGQAEHDAKTGTAPKSVSLLANRCRDAIESLEFYKDCDCVCAVPPSPDKQWDLPTELVKRVVAPMLLDDVSPMVRFNKKKQSIKSLALADKWAALEAAELVVTPELKGRQVVLIDDKYQSGTTIQFVASKLYEAGAAVVLGLSYVKTWRDTDNT